MTTASVHSLILSSYPAFAELNNTSSQAQAIEDIVEFMYKAITAIN